MVENTFTHTLRRLRIVLGDVRADVMEICNCRL